MAKIQQWPDCNAIRIGECGEVFYKSKGIGQVLPTGNFYGEPDNRQQFWTTHLGGMFYSQSGAAYDLATKHVRGELKS